MSETPKHRQPDAWLVEKTDKALSSLVLFIDWLRNQNLLVSSLEAERANDLLANTVSKLILILTEEFDAAEIREQQWVDLILDEGFDRYKEFIQHLDSNIPSDTPSAQYPPTYQVVFDEIKQFEEAIKTYHDDKTATRTHILQFARNIEQQNIRELNTATSRIMELVDKQVIDGSITWDELLSSVEDATNDINRRLLEVWERKKTRKLFQIRDE